MIDAVKRQPWIGAEYESGGAFRKRIMVVADLRDQPEPDTDSTLGTTITVVNEQIERHRARPFWTALVYALTGHAASREARVAVLQSIAVYDYAQRDLEATESNAALFRQTVTTLTPAVLLVLGYRLWQRLPAPDADGPLIAGAPYERTHLYNTRPDANPALAFCMRRPTSSGYGALWHHFVMEALRQVELKPRGRASAR
jgi:hypothetical protein